MCAFIKRLMKLLSSSSFSNLTTFSPRCLCVSTTFPVHSFIRHYLVQDLKKDINLSVVQEEEEAVSKGSAQMDMAQIWMVLVCTLVFSLVVSGEGFNRAAVMAAQEGDRVLNLPGQPSVQFKHYAGYVKLRKDDSKALFYWFFEAQVSAAQKPLVVWLNGGPGCSSVAEGAAQEIGPFLLNGPQFVLNPFSWNKAANMLFLETPVGVGFSYTNNSEDYDRVGDQSAAEDNLAFLVNWYRRFPNYKTNELYISGESYAGHYAPQLADLIFNRNKGAAKDSFINLKGIMMGNVVINNPTDMEGAVDYAWGHGILSDQIYRSIKKGCDFSDSSHTNICDNAFTGFIQAYADIDIFNIYKPSCLGIGKSSSSNLAVVSPLHELFWGEGVPRHYNPCRDYASPYFNRPDVQMALHANVTGLSYPFLICSPLIRKWNDSPSSVLPTIQKLLDAGLRIWIFSGDIDGRVPVTSTRYSLRKLGLKVKEAWRPWYENHQVAGWVQTYKGGLTFATVRGAGHQVPVDKPGESLTLFCHFLSNTSLPASRY
ncbi:hypothetical protein HS088_TW05G00123 [Tripterygium wilfordii]|uniref:Carboxypeptidase n=3 Tax=Tripterygium wilfordii TaxID=458696 RepID=A0A7J7DM02_TRIWF|nr:hypothetical protein HS088_TW05G00123 [Tripterygium wilfordii]